MWLADSWKDYEVLDCSGGEKLERWGKYVLVRPDPQVIWNVDRKHPGWKKPDGIYHRSDRGGGSWEMRNLPEEWSISWEPKINASQPDTGIGGSSEAGLAASSSAVAMRYPSLTFRLKPFQFKHTGLFPEQAANWEWFMPLIAAETARRGRDVTADDQYGADEHEPGNPSADRAAGDQVRVLNLFAYTGGATAAAVAAGAHVTHVDASKGMVGWAKENLAVSGLADRPARFLVDDCAKFVAREIRRGRTYDAVILDPPSYGRGPSGEIWKLEDQIYELLKLIRGVISDRPLFFLLNSYTTGLQPLVLKDLMNLTLAAGFDGVTEAGEIALPVTGNGNAPQHLALPCGASARWSARYR
ncbi:MAG: class I SAM-dependent methyltransferase [Lachnospiraceae bacterium]|nr:class I SAM-dependent methyltransferase [Lachnospiraceae bacterium]